MMRRRNRRLLGLTQIDYEFELKRAAMKGYFGGRRDATNERYEVICEGERPWLDQNVTNVKGYAHLIAPLEDTT